MRIQWEKEIKELLEPAGVFCVYPWMRHAPASCALLLVILKYSIFIFYHFYIKNSSLDVLKMNIIITMLLCRERLKISSINV